MARRLLWKLYPTYILVILLCAGAVMLFAIEAVRAANRERVAGLLSTQAALVSAHLSDRAAALDEPSLQAFCRTLGAEAGARITFIEPGGRVMCDSEADPAAMENHADRPEIRQALESGAGSRTRYSSTRDRFMMYHAVQLRREGRLLGIVRVATPVSDIEAAASDVYAGIILAALAAAVIAAGMSYFVSRRISRRLDEVRDAAERFSRGDLAYKLPATDLAEFAALADALNRMAAELDDKISTVARQRNEREAILAGMGEGLVAVDTDARIISVNGVAAALLGVSEAAAPGKTLQEAVRNVELERLAAHVLGEGTAVEGEIRLAGEAERVIEIRGAPLRDRSGERLGAVMVLNDVTRLRRLETMRRDFVANVSHELKTPITSIKGFVETLMDGAVDDPGEARRFLGIISRQANRLNAIIEDLLSLSAIEQEAERTGIERAEVSVRDALEAAAGVCAPKAEARGIEVRIECEPSLMWRLNPALIEQAVINLVDNAIKYSEPRATVAVAARRDNGGLAISVADTGAGIEKRHIPRLFERFYRADKARSRNLGGTGLGLAIVKHIAQAHGGSVSVDSTPGKGSTFTIVLPA